MVHMRLNKSLGKLQTLSMGIGLPFFRYFFSFRQVALA